MFVVDLLSLSRSYLIFVLTVADWSVLPEVVVGVIAVHAYACVYCGDG